MAVLIASSLTWAGRGSCECRGVFIARVAMMCGMLVIENVWLVVAHLMVIYCRGKVLVHGTCTEMGHASSIHITGLVGHGRLFVSSKVGNGTGLGCSNWSGVFHL
jgi:hypothetical protein